ncbi:MAG: hypothetical protein Q9160_005136 [Pyrenula sp. 1 TL-2023]
MPPQAAPTWLITGSSSGFGWSLVQHALEAGHNVIATSRNPSKTPDLVKRVGAAANGHWMALDVTSPASDLRSKIAEAERVFGGIDILVNNAGYAQAGAFEDMNEELARAQMETNFFGVLKLTQAVLPSMRNHSQDGRARAIINISSGAGFLARPGLSLYAASKHALEAIAESMSYEIAPFNIRMLLVEPGFFHSNMVDTGTKFEPISEAYKDGVPDKTLQWLRNLGTNQVGGSTDKAAQAIFDVIMEQGRAKGKKKVIRLLLGQDCVKNVRNWMGQVSAEIDEMEEISVDMY